jgi:hypothetical protein
MMTRGRTSSLPITFQASFTIVWEYEYDPPSPELGSTSLDHSFSILGDLNTAIEIEQSEIGPRTSLQALPTQNSSSRLWSANEPSPPPCPLCRAHSAAMQPFFVTMFDDGRTQLQVAGLGSTIETLGPLSSRRLWFQSSHRRSHDNEILRRGLSGL